MSERQQRPKLLANVTYFRAKLGLEHSPTAASSPTAAAVLPVHTVPPMLRSQGRSVSEKVWICQECDKAEAVVMGCYCLECVQTYRSCVNCNAPELPHHRASRLRHKSSNSRLQYFCLSCVQQPMMWPVSPENMGMQ